MLNLFLFIVNRNYTRVICKGPFAIGFYSCLYSEGPLVLRDTSPKGHWPLNNIVFIVLLPREPTVMARASVVVSSISKTAYSENVNQINAIYTLPPYHQTLLF